MRERPIIAMDLVKTGKGGGPDVSNMRVMNSDLKNKYDFKYFVYDNELGRGISIKRIFNLSKQLEQIDPDIVHFSGLQLSGFHIILACKLARIKKTIVTIHGFSGDALDIHPIKKMILTYFIEPLTLFLSKKTYGVSEYVVSRRMVRIFANKCCGVIYNLVPFPYESNDDHSIREELGLSSSDILAVSVARIRKDKGYHILDEAISRFRDDLKLKFIIVGEGDYLSVMRKKLEEQILQGQVYFLGYRIDIQRILSKCNFFILPTLHETLSIALLEASVEGLPLIASNTGGVPEIVENGYNGLLVLPGDVNELADAIEILNKNGILRKQFSANSVLRIKEKFSSSVIVSKIDKVYQSLLK